MFHDKNGKGDFKSKGPELLIDLADQTAQALIDIEGMDPAKASQLGRELADRMAGHWGGQNVYFPMGLTMKLSKRDQQIYDAFTGDNQPDLARKFGVSLQWVYRILKIQKQQDIAARQHNLFPQ